MNKPLVMLLAGGGGTRLGVLVERRTKPAVPFGARYRIIDFALSNIMHAGFDRVGVLTQYKPLSLMKHIGIGESWNLHGRLRGIRILPPRTGEVASDWYRGTADAVWQNIDFMQSMHPEQVLILAGDHIYRMDYQRLCTEHIKHKADITIPVMKVGKEDCSRFGMVWTDKHDVVTHFEEKPTKADTQLASMGIYLFEWKCLQQALKEIVKTHEGVDFGHDIVPRLVGVKKVISHRFAGYWRDVGTISSFFQANMDTLEPVTSGLDLDKWEICTRPESESMGDVPPAYFGMHSMCSQTLVTAGCRIHGNVTNSLLSPKVCVEKGATVKNSILMNDVRVRRGAQIQGVIADKGVCVGEGAVIQGGDDRVTNPEYNKCQLAGLVILGKEARVPEGIYIGSNVVVEARVDETCFHENVLDGSTVHRLERL